MALSNPQLIVLTAACQRPDRSIYPLTTKLPGGAAAKVLGSLLNKLSTTCSNVWLHAASQFYPRGTARRDAA
jgi:hypothetical protein